MAASLLLVAVSSHGVMEMNALPPESNVSSQTETHLPSCLNCGTPTPDRFCPHCGQEATRTTASIQHLAHEFISDTFGYDSKLAHTLVPLVMRPGLLTNEYLRGRRAPYLSPFRLYVFLSLVFFLVFAWRDTPKNLFKQTAKETTAAQTGMGKSVANSSQKATSAPPEFDDGKITIGFSDKENASETIDLNALPKTVAEYEAQQRDPKNLKPDSPRRQFFIKRVIMVKEMGLAAFAERFFNNLPKMMFLLLPIFALLLKFIYWRSRRLYIEHLLFALHCHAFVFLALTVMELAQNEVVSGILVIWMLVYLFWAMRVVYRQGIPKTLLKFSILSIVYFTILGFMMLGTIFVTFVTV
jgi:hypothetical protein